MSMRGDGSLRRAHLDELTCATFNRNHFIANAPLLIADGTRKWKAPHWSREYLISHLGNLRAVVSSNSEGIFDYNQTASSGVVRKQQMLFKDALELIFSNTGYRYYVQQQNISEHFPGLLRDIMIPELLDRWKVMEVINLWVSGKGSKTPLHFDVLDNFLVQMMGKKHIMLFPPSETINLYAAIDDLLPHCSRVNAFAPDTSSFPRYAEALRSRIDLELNAGEMLYIPQGWWHAVESTEASVSINFWWKGITKQ